MKNMPTYFPAVGEHLYLRQFTGNSWVDEVKRPYTVIGVDKKSNLVIIQECELVFNGQRYYDTVADEIREDPHGQVMVLRYANTKKYPNRWVEKGVALSDYPQVAVFGQWIHEPYLN